MQPLAHKSSEKGPRDTFATGPFLLRKVLVGSLIILLPAKYR